MKTVKQIICLSMLLLPFLTKAVVREVPFTLEDRDRMIRTEQKVEGLDSKIDTKVNGLRAEMNARFEAVDKQFIGVDKQFTGLRSEMSARFEQLFNFLYAIIGIFTVMTMSVFGFAFWDRKISLAPLKKENLKTLNALRDFAEHQPKLREILKNAGLM